MNSCSFEESSGGNRSWGDRQSRGGDFLAIGKLSDLFLRFKVGVLEGFWFGF